MSINILSFSQNYNSTDITALPGGTGHLIAWKYLGINEDTQLYAYDSYNGANKWYINFLRGTIENHIGTSDTSSLKQIKKTNESPNLTNFFCNTIKVTLNHELNEYYSLENLYVQESENSFRNFISTEVDGNSYYYSIETLFSMDSIFDSFRFTLKYRENQDPNDTRKEIKHDPRHTQIIKLELSGVNKSYNVLNLAAQTIDFREYSKRFYIRDGTEHGYLRYDKINMKYVSGTFTMFEFNIIESSLYKIKVETSDLTGSVILPELKIKGGKLTCSITNSSLLSENEVVTVEYCELYLHESELGKVPNKNDILRIIKA